MAITHVGSSSGGIVTASAGADPSVPYPTGLAANDILIGCMGVGPASEPAFNALSGFTRVISGLSGSGSQSPGGALYIKLATGSESGNLSFANPGSGVARGFMTAYRGVDPVTPQDLAAVEAAIGSSAAYSTASIDPTMTGVTFVGITVSNSGTGTMTPPTAPVNWAELADDATSPHMSVAHLVAAASEASFVPNFVRSGAVRGYVAVLALRPYVEPPPVTDFDGWGVPI